MSNLEYNNSILCIDSVSLNDIAAQFGTPCYVYSRKCLEDNWQAFAKAFNPVPHLICYAVKANSNIAILNVLAKLNSGFDIVSGGELERVLAAGGDPAKIVFSGVGKTAAEIELAIAKNIFCFNVESEPELERLQTIAARTQKKINIALRINPDVDAQTHTYIATGLKENKFGIAMNEVMPICKRLSLLPALKLIGIACHIGSQLTELNPFTLAVDRMLAIYAELHVMNIRLQYLNIGGGLGVKYRDEQPPSVTAYADALLKKLSAYSIKLIIEPGRSIVANAGILLTRVEYLKHTQHKNFAIVDAGMNDLLRPALYAAWQNILPVQLSNQPKSFYEIAGPVCESADFLGKDRELALHPGDLLAVDTAGAYGFSMSSNYNSRCRPAEVMISNHHAQLIRRREKVAELFAGEQLLIE